MHGYSIFILDYTIHVPIHTQPSAYLTLQKSKSYHSAMYNILSFSVGEPIYICGLDTVSTSYILTGQTVIRQLSKA